MRIPGREKLLELGAWFALRVKIIPGTRYVVEAVPTTGGCGPVAGAGCFFGVIFVSVSPSGVWLLSYLRRCGYARESLFFHRRVLV